MLDFKRVKRRPIVWASAFVLSFQGLVGCGEKTAEVIDGKKLPEMVDYNFHVKPILSDRCFACHGPNKADTKAGLSLASAEGAIEHVLEDGGHAIIPKKPKKSEMLKRINSDDESYMMPPPEANIALSDYEKAVLEKWVKQGAKYKKHWAFIAPSPQEIPETKIQISNEIDAFIGQALDAREISPAPPAKKELLLRRVTFDLTGLPPTPAEIDAFLADESPNAFETVVDDLLSRDSHAERLAVEWLDVARYADTHGYREDMYRDMSPYRDWVISAFKDNKPFDEFVTEQLAGDLLKTPSKNQIIATGFNRLHRQNSEGGIVPEEFRVEYTKDRLQTLGTGLMGLTVQCAQCHDHKYDPISHVDYFSLYSFFNNIDENGQIAWAEDQTPTPTLMLPTPDQAQKNADFDVKIKAVEAQLKSLGGEDGFNTWKAQFDYNSEALSGKNGLVASSPMTASDTVEKISNVSNKAASGRVLFGAMLNSKNGPELVHVEHEGRSAIKLNGDDQLFYNDIDGFTASKPFSIAIDIWVPKALKDAAVVHYNKGALLYAYKGFDVSIRDNAWLVRLAHTYPYNSISLIADQPLEREKWHKIVMTYDGSWKAEGVKLYQNGQLVPMNVERDNLFKDIQHTMERVQKETALRVGARFRDFGLKDGMIDDLRVYDRALTSLEVASMAGGDLPKDDAILKEYYNTHHNSEYQELSTQLIALRTERAKINEAVKEVMVMEEQEEARQAYVLLRGEYSNYGEEVSPNVPAAILAFDDELPRNRLGLAQWLLDDRNPLVSRVIVNRYWQMIFGRGIVSTPEDFGNQGALPTHPELLDWLAIEFVKSDWDVKQLLKKMVMSSTYQQSSLTSEDVLQKDPENLLLSRGPTSRLTAEMLRDNVLAASGLLVEKVGGESVYPYQPDGLWEVNNLKYEAGAGEDLYRRSMYTIWKRTVPPPMMGNFDAPTRAHSVGVRQQTSTPLQSLNLMNDPQFVEASRVLAGQVVKSIEGTQAQIEAIYRSLTSVQPDQQEIDVLTKAYNSSYARFAETEGKAKDFLSIGEAPIVDVSDTNQLAAMSFVAGLISTHDATIVKR